MADAGALAQAYCRLDTREEERECCLASLQTLVASGQLSVGALLSELDANLRSTDPSLRTRSTLLLAQVAERIATPLTPPALRPLLEALAGRLADAFCTTPAAQGLVVLLRRHPVDGAGAQLVAAQLFAQGPTGLPVNTRRQMLTLVQVLLEQFRDAMQQIETQVVQGFINLMDGERDPVNLALAFDVHAAIMASLDQTNLGYYHAEMFDVVSCYFPITYTPLPNDPNHITPELLKQALMRCMEFPEFAPHCVPFLTDKLTSPIMGTKIDTLDTLERCVKRYDHLVLCPFLGDLFRAFRTEILAQTLEEERTVLEKLLLCLGLIVDCAVKCEDAEKVQESLAGLINPILNAASSTIVANTASYASMLHYSCNVSAPACSALAKIMVPKLRTLYLHAAALGPQLTSSQSTALSAVTSADGGLTDSMKQRETILILFVALLSAVRKLAERGQTPSCKLSPMVELLLECLLTKSTPTMERAALEGVGYCAIIQCLQQEQVVPDALEDSLYTLLSSIYLNTTEEASRKVALRTIVSICAVNPRAVYERICKAFQPLLTPSSPHLDILLLALRELAACPAPTLVTPPARRTNICVHIVSLVLGVLIDAVDNGALDEQGKLSSALTDIIRPLRVTEDDQATTQAMVALALKTLGRLWARPDQFRGDAPYPQAVYDVALALQYALRTGLSAEGQKALLCQMLGCPTDIHHEGISAIDLAHVPPQQLLLLKAALAAAHAAILPEGGASTLPAVIDALLGLVGLPADGKPTASGPSPRQAAMQCLAVLLNKASDSQFPDWYQRTVPDFLLPRLVDRGAPVASRVHVVHALTWIMKALAMRMASSEVDMLGDQMVNLVADGTEAPAVRTAATEAFEAVMAPAPDVLSKEMGCAVRFLWDQKFFSRQLAQLKEVTSQATDPATAMHAFCAMSGLVKPCREAILLNHLRQLMPMLIQQLKSQAHKHQLNVEDASTKPYVVSTLDTLRSIFTANPSCMKDHFAETLEPLLVFATYMHSNQARLISLQILQSFASIPFQFTRPHKALVTQRLRAVLDDPKRAIRRCATETRHRWFSLTDPEAAAP